MPFEIPPRILELNPRCVPIKPGRKQPAIVDWPNTQVRAQDLDQSANEFDKYGIVIDDDMVVVDVDVHEDSKNGYASLTRIKDDHGIDLFKQASIVVESPSGGSHLYFKKSKDLKLPKSTNEFPGIDFLQKGSQVIGPGSKHSTFEGHYEISRDNGTLSEIPHDLKTLFSHKTEEIVSHSPIVEESPLDSFNTSQSAVDVIKKELELSGYTVITDGQGSCTFIRPGVRDSSYKISGTLGKESKNGRLLLRNFSTSDPLGFPSDASITLCEAYRILKGLKMEDLPTSLKDIGYGNDYSMSADEIKDIQESIRSARTQGEDLEDSYPTQTLAELKKSSPDRRPYVIDGLLRRGETLNLIAAPKTGKSWFVYNLAARLASGGDFLGWTSPHNLKCMIVDNELHPEELAFRVGSVQEAMNVDFGDDLHFSCLRGAAVDMTKIEGKLVAAGASRFDVIILDALYRFIPPGTSENDNAQMMLIYNTIDKMARLFDCSVICVHHSSKGSQNDKQVSDVGAGAGAISRAADTQVVLFPHEEPGMVCVEAITRSSKTPEARSAKLEGFLWNLCESDAVRKQELEPKMDKKSQLAVQNQLKRSSRAKKVKKWLTDNDRIWPNQSQEVLQESKAILRTLLRDHLVPAGVVEFKNFYYERSEAWSERLEEFINNPATKNEKAHASETSEKTHSGG